MNLFFKKKSKRLRKLTFTLFVLFFFISCTYKSNQATNKETLIKESNSNVIDTEPFYMTVTYCYPLGFYNMRYEITGRNLKVINASYASKLSTVYETELPQNIIAELSMLRLDSLKEHYFTPTMDGFSISVNLRNKTVTASNYYLPEIGIIVETINNFIPEKYKMPEYLRCVGYIIR